MDNPKTTWAVNGQSWQQTEVGFFTTSAALAAEALAGENITSLPVYLQHSVWSCTNCVQKKNPFTQLPSTFNFCTYCGEKRPNTLRQTAWLPPNGLGSVSKSFDLGQLNLLNAQDQTIPNPGKGNYVFAYGSAGLKSHVLTAFDLLGTALWVWLGEAWFLIKPQGKPFASSSILPQHFTVAHENETWVLATDQGLAYLTILPESGTYSLKTVPFHAGIKPSLCALSSPAELNSKIYSICKNGNDVCVLEYFQDKQTIHSIAHTNQSTLKTNYQIPIIDAVRNKIMWLAEDHYIVLSHDETVEIELMLFPPNIAAQLQFGSPYQDSIGHWWQLCLKNGQGYGYQKLSSQQSNHLSWEKTDGAAMCIGNFTTRGQAYSRKEPWKELHFQDLELNRAGLKLPLMRYEVPGSEAFALYLDVPYNDSLADFFADYKKPYVCKLKLTHAKAELATLVIDQPWLTQVLMVENTLYLAHPSLNVLHRFVCIL